MNMRTSKRWFTSALRAAGRASLVTIVVLASAMPAWANPPIPNFNGTWTDSADVGAEYTTQSATATINNGITVNVLEGTTITGSGTFAILNTANPSTATLNNSGTLDYRSITWNGWVNSQYQKGTINNNSTGKIIVPNSSGLNNRSGLVLNNYGTMEKRGTGTTRWQSDNDGGTMTFNNIGATITVVEGAFSTTGARTPWNFSGAQAINVLDPAAVFETPFHPLSGSWTGSGPGVVNLVGGASQTCTITGDQFILQIDDGDRTDYTKGGVLLSGNYFPAGSAGYIVNRGKFRVTNTGRWYGRIRNEGWLVWDTSTAAIGYAVAGTRMENGNDGVWDVKYSTVQGLTGSGARYDVVLENGSTFRGIAGAGNTATWSAGIQSVDILNGATVEGRSGTLVLGNTSVNKFNGVAGTISTMNFSATVNDGAVLDIPRLNTTAGITTVGAGSMLTMKGSGVFKSGTLADVLNSKLTTVNGTLALSGGFSLTPGAGGLTVASGGTLAGDGGVAAGGATIGGNLALASGATLAIGINGTTYDTFAVNGTVDVTGSTLSLTEGTPASGSIIVIANDATDAVTGTFAGLAENDPIVLNGGNYRITYAGGVGNNDIVLNLDVVASPPAVSNVAPSAVGAHTATLRGDLTDGGTADITIYYGTNDAYVSGSWQTNVQVLGVGEGVYSAPEVTGLMASQEYWFRNYATNGDGTAWADNKMSFTTTVTTVSLTLTDGAMAEEFDPNGTLQANLAGPSASNVTVVLAFSGVASRTSDPAQDFIVDDYYCPATIVIPAGATSASVGLVAYDDALNEGSEGLTISIASVTNASATGGSVSGTITSDNDLPNPTGTDIGGTWYSSTTVANPTYLTHNNSATINAGVTVTLAAGSTIASGSGSNARFNAGTGTFRNEGTLDYDAGVFRFLNSAITVENVGLFQGRSYADGSAAEYQGYNGGILINSGTIRKVSGAGYLSIQNRPGSVGAVFNNTGGTIEVLDGTLGLGQGSGTFSGNQTITVATGATLRAPDAAGIAYGGTWTGAGGGVVSLWGGEKVIIGAPGVGGTFTLSIDDGNREDHATGGVQLCEVGGFRLFRATVDTAARTVVNKGKFWFNATGVWQANGTLDLYNDGWLVWNPGAGYSGQYANGSDLRNRSGGVIDIIGTVGDGTHNSYPEVYLESGSTLNKKTSTGASVWDNTTFDIKNGATVNVMAGTLTVVNTKFEGASPGSTLNFNARVDSGCTLDLRGIPAGGITTVGAGSALTMKGSGAFKNNTTSVLQSKLATVNGTLAMSDGFSLTPGGSPAALTVASGGTLAGNDGAGGAGATVNGSLNLADGATLRVGLSGDVCDTFTVNGLVSVGGNLEVVASTRPTGRTFVLIANDSNDAVTGEFAQREIDVLGVPYAIATNGGDGNDVTLIVRDGTILMLR